MMAYLMVVKCYLTKVSICISLMTMLSLKASVFLNSLIHICCAYLYSTEKVNINGLGTGLKMVAE